MYIIFIYGEFLDADHNMQIKFSNSVNFGSLLVLVEFLQYQ